MRGAKESSVVFKNRFILELSDFFLTKYFFYCSKKYIGNCSRGKREKLDLSYCETTFNLKMF